MCKDGDNISDGQGPHRTVTEVELELLSSLKSGFFRAFHLQFNFRNCYRQ